MTVGVIFFAVKLQKSEFQTVPHIQDSLRAVPQFDVPVVTLAEGDTEQCEMSRRKNHQIAFPVFIHKIQSKP